MKTFSDRELIFFLRRFTEHWFRRSRGEATKTEGTAKFCPVISSTSRGVDVSGRESPHRWRREKIYLKKKPDRCGRQDKRIEETKRNQPQKTRPWIEKKKKEYIFLENELPVVNWCGCLFLKNLCAAAVENVQNRTGHILNIYMLRYLPSPRLYANK